MIFLDNEEAVIIHIPKCAGKSLRRVFCSADPEGAYWHWRYLRQVGEWVDSAHVQMHILRQMPEWDLLQRRAVIAIVRNPVTRFFSSVREHKAAHCIPETRTILDELDEVRIAYDPRYIHFSPQHRYTHIGNKCHVDFIARAERLHEDLREIGVAAGFSANFFKAIERIERQDVDQRVSEEDLSREVAARIWRLYYRDFILFGYRPVGDSVWKSVEENAPPFERLLVAPPVQADWDGEMTARPAYHRFALRAERDAAMAERDAVMAERDAAMAERDAAMAERDAAMAERDILMQSTSWAATEPLRKIKGWLLRRV